MDRIRAFAAAVLWLIGAGLERVSWKAAERIFKLANKVEPPIYKSPEQ
jgi:hypothetical protein